MAKSPVYKDRVIGQSVFRARGPDICGYALQLTTMPTIELSAGRIDYVTHGDDGPPLIFGHGPPMDHRAWGNLPSLLPGYRCFLPTLPFGGHRHPMKDDADLTQFAIARLLAEFVERLDLTDATVVLNDWGGGQFMITEQVDQRLARFVLAACEAFDNFPPGSGAQALGKVARSLPAFSLVLQLFRSRAFRQMRSGYGGMSVRRIPDDLLVDWFTPALTNAEIRRDFAKFASGAPNRQTLLDRFESMRSFDRRVLIVWADSDHLMPADHGRQLAVLYPHSRYEELTECATLVGLDQPERFAAILTDSSPSPARRPIVNTPDSSAESAATS